MVKIKSSNNARTLFLEGKAVSPDLRDVNPGKIFAPFSEGETGLYRLRKIGMGWTGPQTFNESQIESRVGVLLAADPSACFLLEVSVDAPQWWLDANPAECSAFCLPPENLKEGAKEPTFASWASAKWRNETGRALSQLLRHAVKAKWSERCVGYQIAAGENGSWRHPQAARLPDIGPRMTERFIQFALEKYRRNEGVLRHEWFDAKIQFQRITCPSAREREQANYGAMRNPTRARRLLDYYECFASAQNSAALQMCEVAKKTTEGAALVGLSYGAFSGYDAPAEDGYGYADAVLDSPDVDFLVAPPANDAFPYLPLASLALRGKFVFNAKARPAPTKATPPAASVAIVADYASLSHLRPAERWAHESALGGQMRELERGEVPYDLYPLSDIFHAQLPNYKVWIFPNAYYLSEAERRRIDARFKRNEQTVVFFWGVGLCGEEGVSSVYGQRLYGQKLRVEPKETALRVRNANENDPTMTGQRPKANFGSERAASPTVTISDKSIVRLGANSDNKTNFSLLRLPQWTSVYCGAAPLPAGIVQNLVGVVAEPEAVEISKSGS